MTDAYGAYTFLHPTRVMIEYGMKDICKNTVIQQSLKVGNGKNDVYSANECNEVTLTQPGECITEVTFYRDDRRKSII